MDSSSAEVLRWPALRIRTHLSLLVLATALPLAALIAYIGYSHARAEERDARTQALLAARAIAADTERTLERARLLLDQLAQRPLLRKLDPADCDPLFGSFASLFPEYVNLVTARRSGERVCSAFTFPADAPSTVDPALYLAPTLAASGFTVGPLRRGAITGRWILFLAYPLAAEPSDAAVDAPVGDAGAATGAAPAAGVVALAIDLGRLPLAPSLGELPRGTRARILDATNTVLAANLPALDPLGEKLPPGPAPGGRAPAAETVFLDTDGPQRIEASVPVRGPAWQVRVGVPLDEMLAPVKRRAAASAAISLAGLALTALLAWLLARRLVGSVEAIAKAARHAAAHPDEVEADPNLLVRRRGPVELEALADDFRAMLHARGLAEAAVRESEEQLAITLHSIGDAVIATDPAGRITRMNATAERLTGWPLARALGRPLAEVFQIFDVLTRTPRVDPVQLVLERGSVVELSNGTVLMAADGAEYQVADSAAPIRASSGAIVGVVLVFSDVTREYQVQQALRDNEARLRLITDMLPGPVAHVSRDGRYLFANAAHERWFGLRSEQIVGMPYRKVLGETLYLRYLSFIERARAGEKVSYESTHGSPRDGVLHALVTLIPDADREGGRNGHFVVVFDITERKRAEEALRRSEERLRLVLRGSNDAPWDWNLEAGEWYFSARWWNMLGYGEDMSSTDLDAAMATVVPEDAAMLLGLVREALHGTNEAFQVEYRLLHRGGRVVPVVSRGFILRNSVGRVLRISGVTSDLSERKQAEAERQALEAQLRESQKMESIGTLAGGVAHDFNNILGAILGNVALAQQDAPAEHPVQASLRQISRASLRARDLVEQILAFSRKRPQTLVVQPLRPLVEETLALLRSTLPARVELDSALAAPPLYVNADATQVQQVLVNLCTNGWHALQGRPGRIVVGLESAELNGRTALRLGALAHGVYAHLWVSDTGSGMDEATRARIFEPFFTTKPVGQGTGLGLAVAHGIVATHGGAITVDSALGQGSRFHLYLPLAAAPARAAALSEPAAPAVWGRGDPVLYVDDDEVMLAMVERLLQRAGFRVTCCRSASEALQLVSTTEAAFSVVVTDFNMPDASGLEVARELGRLRPGLPVVVVSGYISEELRQGGQQLGVRSLLEKQHLFEELAPMLARIVASRPDASGDRGVS